MSKVVLRAPGQYDPDAVSLETGLQCPEEEGRTQQQFAEEVDINTIVERFGLTGELPFSGKVPLEGDFTTVVDFHSAMNLVVEAQRAFDELPAELRKRFEYDPGNLVAFLSDDKNREEAEKLGLVVKREPKPRDAVQAIDELAAKLAPAKGEGGA